MAWWQEVRLSCTLRPPAAAPKLAPHRAQPAVAPALASPGTPLTRLGKARARGRMGRRGLGGRGAGGVVWRQGAVGCGGAQDVCGSCLTRSLRLGWRRTREYQISGSLHAWNMCCRSIITEIGMRHRAGRPCPRPPEGARVEKQGPQPAGEHPLAWHTWSRRRRPGRGSERFFCRGRLHRTTSPLNHRTRNTIF